MNSTLKAYLQLCRPANLPTAAADVIAGLSIAGLFAVDNLLFGIPSFMGWLPLILILASVLLYAGGVVMNDVFDVNLDKLERPERPIPSGVVPLKKAAALGTSLLVLGILLASYVSIVCGVIALVLALAILSYDAFAKHHAFLGPFNMGLCRGLNLLLGMAYFGSFETWRFSVIPLVFIFAITMISQGEVHGNNKKNILFAGFLYLAVIFLIAIFGNLSMSNWAMLPFLILFAFMVFKPLVKAYQENLPLNIMKAVKAGVISIVIIDAALVASHSSLALGLLTLLLLPFSILLSKMFAVT